MAKAKKKPAAKAAKKGIWGDSELNLQNQIEKNEDEPEVETASYKTPLLDVDNAEYKQRREEALAKPDAVVIHETYH